jgi:hypothetical protein
MVADYRLQVAGYRKKFMEDGEVKKKIGKSGGPLLPIFGF